MNDCWSQPEFWISPLLAGIIVGIGFGLVLTTIIFLRYFPISKILDATTLMLKRECLAYQERVTSEPRV